METPFERTLCRAREYIQTNDSHRTRLIRAAAEVPIEGVSRRIENRADEITLSKMAAVGIVNLHVDRTYNLSNVGRALSRELLSDARSAGRSALEPGRARSAGRSALEPGRTSSRR